MIFLFIIISRQLSLFFLVETKQIENAMMVVNIKTTNLDIIWLLSILIVFRNSFINLIPSYSKWNIVYMYFFTFLMYLQTILSTKNCFIYLFLSVRLSAGTTDDLLETYQIYFRRALFDCLLGTRMSVIVCIN